MMMSNLIVIKVDYKLEFGTFLEKISAFNSFYSITGRHYEVVNIKNHQLTFERKSTKNVWSIDIKMLYKSFQELDNYTTSNLKEYFPRTASPALGILISSNLAVQIELIDYFIATNQLISLQQHAHNVARFFIYENIFEEDEISPWFRIASGIEMVKFNGAKFDSTIMFCGNALDYEIATSVIQSQIVHQLSIFNFIYNGLEAYIDYLELPDWPGRKGKINSVIYFLLQNYNRSFPQEYNSIVKYLINIIRAGSKWNDKVYSLVQNKNPESGEYVGVKLVSEIRNSLSHGEFGIRQGSTSVNGKPLDYYIISASSRILLLTIQMLQLTATEDLDFKVCQLHHVDNGVDAGVFAQKLHLNDFLHC